MSILPSYLSVVQQAAQNSSATIEIPREYEIDFATGQLTGKIVEGIDAIKTWVWCCMHTQRFRYPIYSWDYGADMEQYVGQALPDEYLEVDLRDEIEEALKVNAWIPGIKDYNFERSGSGMKVSFAVETTLGQETKEEYDVSI